MQQTVESNRTLLVDGPASVRLLSGKAEVFGYKIKESQRIVLREGKRLPLFVNEKAIFDISLGTNASVSEVVGSTIPSSWNKPIEAVLAMNKLPTVVLILGTSDSGKTSLSTYILNKLVNGECKVAILDGDMGQSDIGPSATVGYTITSKQTAELYDLKLKNAFFVGVTSPIRAIQKIIEGITYLKNEVMKQPIDFLLVNTDGWITDALAVKYKTDLIDTIKPDVIVGIQIQDELAPLIANLNIPVIVIESSFALNERTAERRKSLREMTYAKYLRNAKLQCFPKSQITIEPRNALPKNQEPEKRILVGLCGRGEKFLGIGVLREINQVRKVLKVQTAVSAKPIRLIIGKVIVNEKLQEVQTEL